MSTCLEQTNKPYKDNIRVLFWLALDCKSVILSRLVPHDSVWSAYWRSG